MSQYKCQRTFTSQTTRKMFAVGQVISQLEYDVLRFVEKANFSLDADFDSTPTPVFNPPHYTSQSFIHERSIS